MSFVQIIDDVYLIWFLKSGTMQSLMGKNNLIFLSKFETPFIDNLKFCAPIKKSYLRHCWY